MNTTDKFCVVGAGACGLAVVKTFRQRGIPVECLERESDIGGLWDISRPSSSVYSTLQLNSSKKMTCYSDFPMPRNYPFYPSHTQIMEYFRSYAKEFDLFKFITFGATVEHIEKHDGLWKVWIAGDSAPRIYKGVVIANGHHSVPRMPAYPGSFSGEVIHSYRYKSPAQLRGKRVLIVGTGNSGCDIVCDAVGAARQVFHSMRHGFYIVPKFMFGKPTDRAAEQIQRWPVPHWVRLKIYALCQRIAVGRAERFGLPRPRGRFLERPVTIAPLYLHHLGHGKVAIKPGIQSLNGGKVRFVDGSEEEIDMIVYATGYELDIPFIDNAELFTPEGNSRLYMHIFHPEHDTLFAVGLVKFDGGLWRVADYQAQLIANFIVACATDPAKANRLRSLKARFAPDSAPVAEDVGPDPAKRIFVNYFRYRAQVERMLGWLGQAGTAAQAGF